MVICDNFDYAGISLKCFFVVSSGLFTNTTKHSEEIQATLQTSTKAWKYQGSINRGMKKLAMCVQIWSIFI